jgi:uroporphyrinogen-III synthase
MPDSVWRGITVIVTRPLEDGRRLAEEIARRGGEAVVRPLIDVCLFPERLAHVVSRLDEYDGVILTSANAARALRLAAEDAGVDPRQFPPCVPVGKATAKAVQEAGWPVWPGPHAGTAEALARGLAVRPPQRWLFPHGNLAPSTVPDILRAADHDVTAVACYETRSLPLDVGEWQAWLASPQVFATWFSPSAVRACATQCGLKVDGALAARHACIGPTTANECRRVGFPVACVAAQPTEEALLDAMETVLRGSSGPPCA